MDSNEYSGNAAGRRKKPYSILNEEKLMQQQQDDIFLVSSLLGVTKGIACTLLLRHKWTVTAVLDEWVADKSKVRASLGITSSSQKLDINRNHFCTICMETVALSRTLSAACGHPFCFDCWASYVAAAVRDGAAACLALRCPKPKCAAIAGLDVVEAAAAAADKARFHRYLFKSYVESSRNRKWCPAPGCDLAVKYSGGGEGENEYDVICDCGFEFCWRCADAEEHHRPVPCETVAKWAESTNISEAVNWIRAYTKTCPNCHKRIEINKGCNHMTCKCNHEFCWHCMKKWLYGHKCNQYERDTQTAIERSLTDAKEELRRNSFYFDRFTSNHKSWEIARAKRERLPAAWEQIVECRRVLKWSYAYAYYVKEDIERRGSLQKLQQSAETAVERLRVCAEKEMAEIGGFREKLVELTAVTKRNVENLVRALENDPKKSQDCEPEPKPKTTFVLALVSCIAILSGGIYFVWVF